MKSMLPQPAAQTQGPARRGWRAPRTGVHPILVRYLPEPLVLLLYALLIGVIGGYGAVLFRRLINLFKALFFGYGQHALSVLGKADVLLLPIIGLMVVSAMVHYLAPEAKGHGVPEVMAAISENHSIIRPRVVVIKAIASALCIGSGGSVGREGPIVQIGSAFGSVLGQYLHLPERYIRLLVACGAGAGIAATFNAPIGGVMFATEVILGNFALQNFTAIVISSVVSASIGRLYLGNHPSFPAPPFHSVGLQYLWVYVVIGLVAGVFSFVYIKVLYGIEDWFSARPWPFWAKAGIGGALIGIIGIWFPQIFGVGYSTVDKVLGNHLGLTLLLALLVLKLLATSVTIAAGGSGGVFAPGLYMGSMLGGAIGLLLSGAFPHSGLSESGIAAITMAAVFAGSAQAPVTSIMMLFEMTGDYRIILPLMMASVLSATVASTLSRETMYTLKLFRRGLDVQRRRQPDRMKAMFVGEALAKEQLTLHADARIEDAWKRFSSGTAWFALVRDDSGVLLGSVARAHILEALNNKRHDDFVSMLLPDVIHHVDERATLAEALSKMHNLHVTYLLVYRENIPIGVIGSSDIVRTYEDVE